MVDTGPRPLGGNVRQVLDAVDGEACIELARELVGVPSITGDERAVQEVVARALSARGLEVDSFEADLAALCSRPDFPGMEVERTSAVLVTGAAGPTSGRSLILNGHVDVVPVGTRLWRFPPFAAQIEGGRLYGRGSCDMKAGLAAGITAAAALLSSGIELQGRVVVQSVVGEEDGGVGTYALVAAGQRADAAVVLEPTRLKIVPAQAGALSFRLRVSGKSAHASVRYEGVSAVDKFRVIEAALCSLEEELNRQPHHLFSGYQIPYPLSIGILSAGEWSASVPDRLQCEGRVGVPVGSRPQDVRARLEAAVAQACAADEWLRENPAEVEWFGGQFAPAEADVGLPIFRTLAEMHQAVLGSAPELGGAPYGSDMRLLANQGGIPTVLYGPGDIRLAHQVDESIELDEVVSAARILAATAAEYLGA